MAEKDQKPPETTTDPTRQWRKEAIRQWLIDSRNPFLSATWWRGGNPYPGQWKGPFSRGYAERGRENEWLVVDHYVRLAHESADVFAPSYKDEIDEFGEETVKKWMVHRLLGYLLPRVKLELIDAALRDGREDRAQMYLEMLRGGEYESEKFRPDVDVTGLWLAMAADPVWHLAGDPLGQVFKTADRQARALARRVGLRDCPAFRLRESDLPVVDSLALFVSDREQRDLVDAIVAEHARDEKEERVLRRIAAGETNYTEACHREGFPDRRPLRRVQERARRPRRRRQ
jgi:hypothetical protein